MKEGSFRDTSPKDYPEKDTYIGAGTGLPGMKAGRYHEDKSGTDREWMREGRMRKSGGALSEVSKHTSKGGLHRSLGIPEGEKIGAKRIAAATHSSNPKTRRQARLAQTYAKHRP